MIEQDTIRLLRECDAGIQMGVSSIDDVVDHVHSRGLKKIPERLQGAAQQIKRRNRYHAPRLSGRRKGAQSTDQGHGACQDQCQDTDGQLRCGHCGYYNRWMQYGCQIPEQIP